MYGWNDNMWGMGGWIAMAALMVLFGAGLVTVIVVLRRTRLGQETPGRKPSHHAAEDILNERFARGEIDESEFTARRDVLRRSESRLSETGSRKAK